MGEGGGCLRRGTSKARRPEGLEPYSSLPTPSPLLLLHLALSRPPASPQLSSVQAFLSHSWTGPEGPRGDGEAQSGRRGRGGARRGRGGARRGRGGARRSRRGPEEPEEVEGSQRGGRRSGVSEDLRRRGGLSEWLERPAGGGPSPEGPRARLVRAIDGNSEWARTGDKSI